MPTLDEEQIKGKIADGSISAISVDTAVFDAYGCNLDHAVLARLDQFKKGGVKLLLSEVVVNEIAAHITRDASTTLRALRSALKKHHRRWKLQDDLDRLNANLNLDVEPARAAVEQVEAYLEAVGAEVIAASGKGDLAAEALRRYFAIVTPFEARETKKHEFPDAFALLSLEQIASERNTLIVCVSPDKGWAAFAEQSDHLVVVPRLDAALSWFNDPGRNVAEKVVALWRANKTPNLVVEVERAFEYYLDDSFDVEGLAPLSYEAEPVSAALQYVDTDKIEPPVVIAEDDDQVTFTVRAIAKVGFEAEFNFYSYDSIDHDNVNLGSRGTYREEDLPFEITISVAREFVDGELDVLEVNVTSRQIVVDFGYVDPFPHADPS